MTHKPKLTKAMMRMIGSRNLDANVRHPIQLILSLNDNSIRCVRFYLSTFKFDQIMIFKVPCGNQTSTYAKDINLCAATGGTHYGRLSAQACWEACTGHHVGCNGVMVSGIVFKKGTCGCVPVNHLRACSTNINGNDTSITEDDYEYFEPGGSNCVITGKFFNF